MHTSDIRNYPHKFEIFRDVIRYRRDIPCMFNIDPDDFKSAFITIGEAIDANVDLRLIPQSTRA